MLSMKTLRVAIVTMGCALLLGSGLAIAHTIVLDSRDAAERIPVPYALETLGSTGSAELTVDRVDYYGLASPVAQAIFTGSEAGLTLSVNAERRILSTEEVYIRVALSDGMVFNAIPTISEAEGTIISGGAEKSIAVFQMSDVALNDPITVQVDGGLSVAPVAGSYSAMITAHGTPDDAIDGIGARSTVFSGSGSIVNVVSGLDVRVVGGSPAVADVNVGFLWFVGPNAAAPNVAQKNLGWFSVAAREFTGGINPLDAGDGTTVDADADLVGAGGIGIEVEGDLSVGAFSFIDGSATDEPNSATGIPDLATAACPGGDATEAMPDTGTLTDDDGDPLVGEEGEAATATSGSQAFSLGMVGATPPEAAPAGSHHVYALCVNVDVLGKETNTVPIPVGDYIGTVSITGPTPGADPQMAATGEIGLIRRNGASVVLPYLTTSEKHNQRLIIVNRGTRDVTIANIVFTTEAGTEVELMPTVQAEIDAGLLMIPAKSSYVARMDETISITGDSRRVAAHVAFAATPGALSVATTQVNVSDGSTDTVVYTVN